MLATVESALKPADAVLDEVCLAGDPWAKVLKQGQILRIVDLEGNQAVDFLMYAAADDVHGLHQGVCARRAVGDGIRHVQLRR